MIQSEDVKIAITSAQNALSEKKDLSWIQQSSVIKRAYYLGLFIGLQEVATNEDDLKPLLLAAYADTMFAREGDDSLQTTDIGRAFRLLQKNVYETEQDNHKGIQEAVSNLRKLVEEREHELHNNAAIVHEILSKFVSNDQLAPIDKLRSERRDVLGDLERFLRFISLLETEHLLTKRLHTCEQY